MPCLLALFAAFFPRLTMVFLWIVRPGYVDRAFHSAFVVPVLGIVFLPFATLVYVLLYTPGVGLTPYEWIWVAIAAMLDVIHWAGVASQRRYAAGYYRQVGS